MKSVQAFLIKLAQLFLNNRPLFTLAGLVLMLLINRPTQ